MSSLQEIKVLVDQLAATAPLSNGAVAQPVVSKLGALYVADWQQRLIDAGRAYSLPLGTITGAASYTALTGNATVDNDQPEFIIAVDTGWLIPMWIDIQISVDDCDAYDDVDDILVIADRSQATAAGATATVATALNLLDGGDAFAGRCFTTVTGDVTDPVASDVLAYKYTELTQVATEASGVAPDIFGNKGLYKRFPSARYLAGPCQIVGFVTGTNTPTYMGEIVFAHLPANWVTVS